MRLKNLDLLLAVMISGITLGWAWFPNRPALVGLLIVLPSVFFLPGYTLTEALFLRSTENASILIQQPHMGIDRPLTNTDRIIISLGLSLGLVILSGFILNMLPMGMQASSWAICLGFIITTFSIIVFFRRLPLSSNETNTPSGRLRVSIYDVILLLLALGITALSFNYAVNIAQQQQYPGFTQLWMIPSKQADTSCAVLIGLHNSENKTLTYHVTLSINGTQKSNWSLISLKPQQEWNQSFPLKPETADNMNISAQLYLDDQPDTVYREVHVSLNVTGQNTTPVVHC